MKAFYLWFYLNLMLVCINCDAQEPLDPLIEQELRRHIREEISRNRDNGNDTGEPFQDKKPASNPYETEEFGRGVDRYRRAFEAQEYDAQQKRERADRERQVASQAAVQTKERMNEEANILTRDKAKKEGLEKYLYKDEQGVLKSALTPEQTAEVQRRREEEANLQKKREYAKFRKKEIYREYSAVYKSLLTKVVRESLIQEMEIKKTTLEMITSKYKEGKIKKKDFDEQIETLQSAISTMSKQLAVDDADKAKKEELKKNLYAEEDIINNRPKDLTIATPSDPQDRINFIENFNTRLEKYELNAKATQEQWDKASKDYRVRIESTQKQYDDWIKGGGTPGQIERANLELSKAFSNATAQYLQETFKFDMRTKDLDDERRFITLMRPIIHQAVSDQNASSEKENKRITK